MATAKGPWNPQGLILFSQGSTSYEFLRHEEFTHHGEHIMLAWKRTPLGAEGQVLVRCLPPDAKGHTPEALARIRARLEEEVRLASYLEHPNIARILARCESNGVLYVVTEFVPGPSLHTLLSASMMRNARLSEAFVLYVGAEVASALHHAHTRTDEHGWPLGIIHRDVSPGRIYLRPDGRITLTDFALARSLLPGRVNTTIPRARGDTFYASPEELLCQPMDARSDMFSLGLVLLELATWKVLYATAAARPEDLQQALTPTAREKIHTAETVAVTTDMPEQADDCILRAATYSPKDVEEMTEALRPPLRSILRALLRYRPADRPASAAAVEAELRAGLAALGTAYGAAEALDEARRAVSSAASHRDAVTPAGKDYLPGVPRLSGDILPTRSGGA
ncbi:serine/threonine-protein kinase [Hyalangium versicolor]|uniref:serine/threonine-protein kinase n=1 Tax=Hyalangium versicolor TaxID=2861190 RepID=UPI001CCD523C|nr:serine/threonine-protein kinase [Hyalangium versicolor]